MTFKHLPPPEQPLLKDHATYEEYARSFETYMALYDKYKQRVDAMTTQRFDPAAPMNIARQASRISRAGESSGSSYVSIAPSDSASNVSAPCNKATFQKLDVKPRSQVDVFVRKYGTDAEFIPVEHQFPGRYAPTPEETHNYVPRNAKEMEAKIKAQSIQAEYEWKVVERKKKTSSSASSKSTTSTRKTGKGKNKQFKGKVSDATERNKLYKQQSEISIQQPSVSKPSDLLVVSDPDHKKNESLSMVQRLLQQGPHYEKRPTAR